MRLPTIYPLTNGRFDSQRFLKACKVKAFCEEAAE